MVAKFLLDASTERETQVVEPEAYFRLITSRRRLVRADDGSRGLLGLFDVESRECFVVDARKVWKRWTGDAS